MYRTALYNSCITICFFRAVFAWFDIKLCKESLHPVCQAVCGFVSFIKIGQKKTSVINSPLFYRLNYARITDPILYLKSAQVKDFLNILYYKFWGLFSAACVWFCVFFSHIRTRKQKAKISTWFLWNITCCLLCIFCAWPCVKC